jgi:hypothetical protein
MAKRTAKDMVDDLIAKGNDWVGVLAVARAVRNGDWYDEAKAILEACGLMPKTRGEQAKLRAAAKEQLAQHYERLRLAKPTRQRPSAKNPTTSPELPVSALPLPPTGGIPGPSSQP